MKENITEQIPLDNIFGNSKIKLKRKCSGKFEVFVQDHKDPIVSIPNMKGDHFTIGSDFLCIGMDKIVLKYESEYIREKVGYEL